MSSIFEIYGTDAHSMTLQLMQAANVATMIPKGASVALKPNLVVASAPETGAPPIREFCQAASNTFRATAFLRSASSKARGLLEELTRQ